MDKMTERKMMMAALDIRRENAEQALARIRDLKAIVQIQEQDAIRRVNEAHRALKAFEDEANVALPGGDSRTVERRCSAPVVRTDPVMEAIARKLHGIAGVCPGEQAAMIRRAAKAGAQALRERRHCESRRNKLKRGCKPSLPTPGWAPA